MRRNEGGRTAGWRERLVREGSVSGLCDLCSLHLILETAVMDKFIHGVFDHICLQK